MRKLNISDISNMDDLSKSIPFWPLSVYIGSLVLLIEYKFGSSHFRHPVGCVCRSVLSNQEMSNSIVLQTLIGYD